MQVDRNLRNILFLCTGNACRSIIAEAIFNNMAPAGWSAMSAGSHPTGMVHPMSLALLKAHNIETAGLHSKSWDALPVVPDIVITVCASAAGEACPAYLGQVMRAHWGVEDPARASEEEIQAMFTKVYDILRNRISAFAALPLGAMADVELKQSLDNIGQLS